MCSMFIVATGRACRSRHLDVASAGQEADDVEKHVVCKWASWAGFGL